MTILKLIGLTLILSLSPVFADNPSQISSEELTPLILGDNLFPGTIDFKGNQWSVEYTIDEELTGFIIDSLKKNKPTYSAIAVIDNETGKILAAVGYEKKNNRLLPLFPFTSSHPSASLAKFVTAAVLLEEKDINLEDKIAFVGKTTTLKYRQIAEESQTKKKRKKRRHRYQNFIEAFASSNNPIFGKAAIENLSGETLQEMAILLGFNRNFMSDLQIEKSNFGLAEGNFMVAQYASGYNNTNTISPVHAAFIPSIIINDGYFYAPHLVERLTSLDGQTELSLPELAPVRVFSSDVAQDLKQMMEATITIGTGRRGFHNMEQELLDKLDIGGKSGTFSGGKPYGKRDWFMAFAAPKDETHGLGISLAVMSINSKKKVRSSKIVKDIIEYYFRDLDRT